MDTCDHFFVYDQKNKTDQCSRCKLDRNEYLIHLIENKLSPKTEAEGEIVDIPFETKGCRIHIHSWVFVKNTWKCTGQKFKCIHNGIMYHDVCDKKLNF